MAGRATETGQESIGVSAGEPRDGHGRTAHEHAAAAEPPVSLEHGSLDHGETEEGATSAIYLPPFRIDVTVRPGVPHLVSRHRVAAAARAALEATGAPSPASIGVVLSGDAELAQLNTLHMGASGATDVLSFPFFPPEAFPEHERGVRRRRDHGAAAALKQAFALPPGLRAHLGDVIVSVERAIAQADQGLGGQTGDIHWTPAEELLLLVVHGTLHVCGWDHDEPVEEGAMRTLERQTLEVLAAHDLTAHPGHEG